MKNPDEMSFDEFDEYINPRPSENEFDRIVDRALSRRDLLKGVVAFGGVAAFGNTLMPTQASAADSRFAFEAIAASTEDNITVPPGYTVRVKPSVITTMEWRCTRTAINSYSLQIMNTATEVSFGETEAKARRKMTMTY